MTSIAEIILFILTILMNLLIFKMLFILLIRFEVLNIRQPIVAKIYSGLLAIFAPIQNGIKRLFPKLSFGGLDFSFLIIFIGLYALRTIIQNNFL